jgi:hypothetical protein
MVGAFEEISTRAIDEQDVGLGALWNGVAHAAVRGHAEFEKRHLTSALGLNLANNPRIGGNRINFPLTCQKRPPHS